ncbi:MAG: pyridoxal-phosphate-dependent aminotransferase family protein [Candidatus Methanomethylicaceae archaeon]
MSLPPLIMLPGPTNVPPRVYSAMCKPMINHRGHEFHELFTRLLENAKKIFQTENDLFVLTSSGTGGVECVASNILLPGEKVLVPVFGTFSERLSDAFKVYGVSVVQMNIEAGKTPTSDAISKVLDRDKEIKAVALVYNETSTGATVRDQPEISRIVKDRGLLYIVDAISVLGGDDLPVDKWGIDVCITATQKCLATPPGLSLISVSKDAWKMIERSKPRTEYFDLIKYRKFRDEKKETPFTPAINLFYALDEALQMILEYGLERWIERHKKASAAYYSALHAMGLSFFAEERSRSHVVIAINTPSGVSSKDLRDILRKRYGVVVAGGFGPLKDSIFRIGNMGVITPKEVLTTLSAVESSLLELGRPVPSRRALSAAVPFLKDL